MADSVRVGVIGLGMGRHHLESYLRLPGVDVVALADANETLLSTIQRQHGIANAYTDYRALLERPDVDAVSVAVPNYLHERFCVDALEAGKHVLCEKPLATTIAEGDRIAATVARTGKQFMIGFKNRFRTDSEILRALIVAGELGELYHARAGWLRRRLVQKPGGWFTVRALSGGGPLIDLGVHMLDLALWLMGSPAVVSVSGVASDRLIRQRSTSSAPMDVEDFASALIRLADGASIQLDVSWVSYVEHRELIYCDLYGDAGGASIRREPVNESFQVFTGRHGVELNATPILPVRDPELSSIEASLLGEVRHFVDCVRDGIEPIASVRDGLAILEALTAIYESARLGRDVAIAELRQLPSSPPIADTPTAARSLSPLPEGEG